MTSADDLIMAVAMSVMLLLTALAFGGVVITLISLLSKLFGWGGA